ncbi:hypothetical protein PsorP6_002830 [Peronosclerospora sorghi]|uniref:Uncharacterized protein n=1 Tax=Peronosclerospora sorghi TaxID=230839 RepID=A0ACC0VLH8_9STRA|nr:hypothetical protein PsorP6_002830 [Peronosclerospora sorghi]
MAATTSTCTNNGDGNHNASSHSLDALFLLDPDAIKLPTPDFRQCLLHQKLQLLNICILSEAQALKPATTAPFNTLHEKRKCFDQEHIGNDSNLPVAENERDVDDAGSCPSDDEFFDSIEQDQVPRLSLPRCREGILCEAVGVVCLQTNEPLFEPRIQTCVPMTEDVAKEQQDLLTRLGASIESDKLRQQLQSTTLISDMQAFKAANHRCCLADFIRWYSPKDWIPFETLDRSAVRELPPEGRGVWWFEEHGMLSERMRFGSGREHIWHQMWEASAPIPASRQKRTFDPVQESEKIFHYLETLAPHELFHQMLAGAISSGVFALETALPVHVSATTLPVVYSALKTLRSHGNRSIFLLDEVLAQSQVAFTAASRRKVNEQEASNAAVHQCQQHQVAFEMALDALWKFVHSLEVTEVLVTKALSLCKYFLDAEDVEGSLSLVNLLLVPSPSHQQLAEISELLKKNNLRQLVTALVLSTPEVGPPAPPVQREYVLRCICPRPFLREYYGDENCLNTRRYIESEELEEMPLVVSRMYAAFKKQTVRFALVLAESEF